MQLSSDGLLRLSIEELLCLPIEHLLSGLDAPDHASALRVCGSETEISGYTEWVSISRPAVSIGWDWKLQLRCYNRSVAWQRVGKPRTNVMLVYASGADTGWARNLELLSTVVDALPWQDRLGHAVGMAPHLC